MVDFKTNTIILNNQVYPINKWETWFQTPFGLVEDPNEAVKIVEANDMDSRFVVLPVPVAVARDRAIYEVVVRL